MISKIDGKKFEVITGSLDEDGEGVFTQGKIINMDCINGVISVEMDHGKLLHLIDDGQLCCEARYITTDDTLYEFHGAILTGFRIDHGPCYGDGFHESAFLKLFTDRGIVTFQTHNEHNGYYGGFNVRYSIRQVLK